MVSSSQRVPELYSPRKRKQTTNGNSLQQAARPPSLGTPAFPIHVEGAARREGGFDA